MREAKIHPADKGSYRSDWRWKCRRSTVKVLWPFLLVVLSIVAVSAENLLDVGVAATRPIGLDAEHISFQQQHIELVAPADIVGTYLLEIRSLEISGPSRQYELEVEPLRPTTQAGEKESVAQQAVAQASVLRADWTKNSLRRAIDKYEEAALIWLSMNNLQRAAAATIQAGEVCLILGEYQEALTHYRKAAAQANTAGAVVEESRALSEAGRLYSYLGDNGRAERNVLAALKLLAPNSQVLELEVRKDYAECLNNLGEISYSKGDLLKSSKQFEEALKIFDEIGERTEAARAHLFRGYIAGGLGDSEKAAAEISHSVDLYRAMRNKSGEGLALTALGLVQSLNGHEDHAIAMHREAIEIFRNIGDRQSEAIAVNGLGQAYENLTEYSTALENYQQALRLFQDTGSLDFSSVATFNVARAYRLLGDLKHALEYYQKCLVLSRSAKKVRTEANALNEVAAIYAAQGNREKTISQYRTILRFYAAIADRRQQAIAWNNLGDSYVRFGETHQALISYNQALSLSKQAGDKGVLISSLYNLARAQRDAGALEPALSNIEQSIRMIEDLRTNVASPDFRASYFSGVHKHYDLLIDVLMQLDRRRPGHEFAAAALLASEKARARSLLDMVTAVRADIRSGVAPQLLSRERELQGLLRSHAQYQMELSISGKDPAETEEVARQLNQLTTEYQELESQLVDRNPRFQNLVPSAVSSLEEIQGQLRDSDTILLEYALGDERSYLWAVTANSMQGYELPSRSILETAGREVYKLLTARQAVGEKIDGDYQAKVDSSDRLYYEKALQLSQLLFGRVQEQLGGKRLIIVNEGILQYIPVEALPAPLANGVGATSDADPAIAEGQPLLIATHEIVTLPSVSTLAAIRNRKHEVGSSERVVAVLADPVFSNSDDRVDNGSQSSVIASKADQSTNQLAVRGFEGAARRGGPSRLAHAAEEADAILAAAPRGTGMIASGFDASRETAMSSRVAEYRILHFATHGFLNTERPELSGIVLSMVNRNGSKTNGFMSLQDIYSLDLSAEVVVLSACDTALGKDVKGEGLVGLTHGFMAAGARSVVASLWKVDDRATAVLMANFYKAMLEDGLTPAAALRSAKQKVRQEKSWQAPYFWAGFELQGEYNQRIVVDHGAKSTGLGRVLTLALVLAGLIIYQRRRRSHLTRQ